MPSFIYKLNSFFSQRSHFEPKLLSKKSHFYNRHFQIKHTFTLVALTTFGLCLALIPVYYFFHQNYEAFSNLAYGDSARLLSYIEQEKKWIHILFFSVFIGFLIFVSILGFRMTSQVVKPIYTLSFHLEDLAKKKWCSSRIPIDEKEEFYSFIETYNFFLSSYQKMLKKDLKNLESLKVSLKDSKSLLIIKKMIYEKELQFTEEQEKIRKSHSLTSLNVLNDKPSDDLFHAS